MTNQFKFGDMVRLKTLETSEIIGLVVKISHKYIWVVFDNHEAADVCNAEEFELIPHPDTVRLDWLADRNNQSGSVLLPRECVEKHLDSLRDAIDAAMQLPTDN